MSSFTASVYDAVTSATGYGKKDESSKLDAADGAGSTTDSTTDSTTGLTDRTAGVTDRTAGVTDTSGDTERTAGQAADDYNAGTTETSTKDTTSDNTGYTDTSTDTSGDVPSTETETSGTTDETTTESAPSSDSKPAERDTSHEDIQSSQGADPNLTGDAQTGKIKMTGTGAPGSHSALFGLTPDGHKETESSSVTTAPMPSTEDSKQEAMGGGKEGADVGGSREQDRSEGVADQIHDPKVAEKGHDGGPIEGTGKSTSEA